MTSAKSPLRKTCSNSTCAYAGRSQLASKFGRNSTAPDGLHSYCKVCNNAKQRDWKKANPEKVREWKKRYIERNKIRNQGTRSQLHLNLSTK